MEENIEQLTLFPLETVEVERSSYGYVNDPYWDELVGEHSEESNKTSVPQHPTTDSSATCVGEQPEESNKIPVPQHKFTHFVEKYWVERGSKKHFYWRYMWVEGEGASRKIRRRYLGRYSYKVEAVQEAIADGLSPNEIREMIVNW
jgi:hypothetical protein